VYGNVPGIEDSDKDKLPEVKYLALLNTHHRDADLQFFPSSHVYTVRGTRTLGSVTGLVHLLAEHFDEDATIRRMLNSSRWPRPGYVNESIIEPHRTVLLESIQSSRMVELFGAPLRDEEDICREATALLRMSPQLRSALRLNPQLRDAVLSIAMSPAKIKDMWQKNREGASAAGTWMHFVFEAWLNRIIHSHPGVEFKLFSQVVSQMHGETAYRTEWMIHADMEMLAGSIDFVTQRSDGSLVLYDWKRSKQLKSKCSPFFGRTMKAPLDHVPDCQGWHYRLQLNCYKFILEARIV